MDAESGKALLSELSPQSSSLKVNDDGTGFLSFKLGNATINQ